jgi:predicted RNase H-like nuclease (RuvC/YqgF family)
VFDVFKKPGEEQNNGEHNTAEPIENLEETCEESKNEEVKAQKPFENTEADMLSMLESLGGEERILIAEKSQLLTMEETLRQRIRDEIEVKRHRIENLKYEIPELKQRCEALAKALDIPIQK